MKKQHKIIVIMFLSFMVLITFISNISINRLIVQGHVQAAENKVNLKYNLKRVPHSITGSDRINFYLPDFHVRGIYVSGWIAGTDRKMQQLINLVDLTVLNAMVIDIKDQGGRLSYASSIGLARELKANQNKIKNMRGLLQRLHARNIYAIARIAVFKDSLLASSRPDLALPLWDPAQQKVIYSQNWVDPSARTVWDYNIGLAREAVRMGFDEIQFDYIRYPAMANNHLRVVLPVGKTKSQVINRFAAYAQNRLSDLSVPISIDVFGLTTTVKDDLGIGQNFRQLADVINIISPMTYPSHYAQGSFGIEVPASKPYQIVHHSMSDARQKLIDKKQVTIRPWLQDFSLDYKYTYLEVLQQIQAVESLGIKEWLLWNPRSIYTERALLDLTE